MIEMGPMQVDKAKEKLELIRKVVEAVYYGYGNDFFDLMDKDSLLYALCGALEAINELEASIENDQEDDTNLPS
jgi:hypothetical protein